MHSVEAMERLATAAVLGAIGILQIIFPEHFHHTNALFARAFNTLNPEQARRLWRALEARRDAEAASPAPMRYTGFAGVVAAGLVFVPSIPAVLPFSVYCLAAALGCLASFFLIRRATQRRTAPLVRRSPFDALPPAMIAAFSGCMFGALVVAAIPHYRVASIIVIASMLVLAWIAWRIAGSASVIFGDDPQAEYAVDERLRTSRAIGALGLACSPAMILVVWSLIEVPRYGGPFGVAAMLVTEVSFVAVLIITQMTIRRGGLQLGEASV